MCFREAKIEAESPKMSAMVQSSTPFTLTKVKDDVLDAGSPATTPILVQENKRRVCSSKNTKVQEDETSSISRRQIFKKRRISWDETVVDKEDEDPDIVESSQVMNDLIKVSQSLFKIVLH